MYGDGTDHSAAAADEGYRSDPSNYQLIPFDAANAAVSRMQNAGPQAKGFTTDETSYLLQLAAMATAELMAPQINEGMLRSSLHTLAQANCYANAAVQRATADVFALSTSVSHQGARALCEELYAQLTGECRTEVHRVAGALSERVAENTSNLVAFVNTTAESIHSMIADLDKQAAQNATLFHSLVTSSSQALSARFDAQIFRASLRSFAEAQRLANDAEAAATASATENATTMANTFAAAQQDAANKIRALMNDNINIKALMSTLDGRLTTGEAQINDILDNVTAMAARLAQPDQGPKLSTTSSIGRRLKERLDIERTVLQKAIAAMTAKLDEVHGELSDEANAKCARIRTSLQRVESKLDEQLNTVDTKFTELEEAASAHIARAIEAERESAQADVDAKLKNVQEHVFNNAGDAMRKAVADEFTRRQAAASEDLRGRIAEQVATATIGQERDLRRTFKDDIDKAIAKMERDIQQRQVQALRDFEDRMMSRVEALFDRLRTSQSPPPADPDRRSKQRRTAPVTFVESDGAEGEDDEGDRAAPAAPPRRTSRRRGDGTDDDNDDDYGDRAAPATPPRRPRRDRRDEDDDDRRTSRRDRRRDDDTDDFDDYDDFNDRLPRNMRQRRSTRNRDPDDDFEDWRSPRRAASHHATAEAVLQQLGLAAHGEDEYATDAEQESSCANALARAERLERSIEQVHLYATTMRCTELDSLEFRRQWLSRFDDIKGTPGEANRENFKEALDRMCHSHKMLTTAKKHSSRRSSREVYMNLVAMRKELVAMARVFLRSEHHAGHIIDYAAEAFASCLSGTRRRTNAQPVRFADILEKCRKHKDTPHHNSGRGRGGGGGASRGRGSSGAAPQQSPTATTH
jgi:hypothetical protein